MRTKERMKTALSIMNGNDEERKPLQVRCLLCEKHDEESGSFRCGDYLHRPAGCPNYEYYISEDEMTLADKFLNAHLQPKEHKASNEEEDQDDDDHEEEFDEGRAEDERHIRQCGGEDE